MPAAVTIALGTPSAIVSPSLAHCRGGSWCGSPWERGDKHCCQQTTLGYGYVLHDSHVLARNTTTTGPRSTHQSTLRQLIGGRPAYGRMPSASAHVPAVNRTQQASVGSQRSLCADAFSLVKNSGASRNSTEGRIFSPLSDTSNRRLTAPTGPIRVHARSFAAYTGVSANGGNPQFCEHRRGD